VTLANRITIGRLVLIPFFLTAVALAGEAYPQARWIALALFIIAAVSDGVDGYIARHHGQRTKLGAVLDPTADKLLVNSAFVFLAVNRDLEQALPYWFPVVMLSRDIFIVTGGWLVHEFVNPIKRVRPSWSGKVNTVLQMAVIIAVLIAFPWTPWIYIAATAMAVLSLLHYLVRGVREVKAEGHA